MRELLRPYDGQRRWFTATFMRYGTRNTPDGPRRTMLVHRVCEEKSGVIVTDHLWFTVGGGLRLLGTLDTGDRVRFNARVGVYQRHDVTTLIDEDDYGLFQPACWSKLEEG